VQRLVARIYPKYSSAMPLRLADRS
jgi:hypothetical protein